MRQHTYLIFIEDIIESIEKIERYINDMKYKEFSRNDLVWMLLSEISK